MPFACRSARLSWSTLVLMAVAVGMLTAVMAAERSFPFDRELLLDADPVGGAKRVPSLDVAADGAVSIDLTCQQVQGHIVVNENTITVMTGAKTERHCPPERVRSDEDVLSVLTQVTTWRRDGDSIVLIGPRTLRFRLPTN